MAKLVTIDEWLSTTFTPDSRPCKKTVYRWIKKKPSMARRMGGRLFIVAGTDIPQTTEQEMIDKIAEKL